ncbi:hypothetical protein ILUMI_02763 [Ignelater luminosus]|uniref:Transposable element P transposase n=1 Tax=Ignelater luminosus TaxID=2038154 RepID=A0A8K0DHM6_IGNLU|nr:hypothetical protein ILUMI_02763 [Ignelater luminosus]
MEFKGKLGMFDNNEKASTERHTGANINSEKKPEKLVDEFEKIQVGIEQLNEDDDENMKERELFEKAYYSSNLIAKCILKKFLKKNDRRAVKANVRLADSNFNKSAKLGNEQPLLHKTKLGWIISGPILSQFIPEAINRNLSWEAFLHKQVSQFWDLEKRPTARCMSKEEKECESYFLRTVQRNEEGHFVVPIPFKKLVQRLGDLRQNAFSRIYSLERKLKKHPQLQQNFTAFMAEYERLGLMLLVGENEEFSVLYYLPHDGVVREESVTTKLCVVFDGSTQSDLGYSLNNLQFVGPTIQNDLLVIILRFRQDNYVVSADIAKLVPKGQYSFGGRDYHTKDKNKESKVAKLKLDQRIMEVVRFVPDGSVDRGRPRSVQIAEMEDTTLPKFEETPSKNIRGVLLWGFVKNLVHRAPANKQREACTPYSSGSSVENPKLQCSVGINEDLSVFGFVENVKLTSIGNLKLPEYINYMNVIDKLLSDINQDISEREDSGMCIQVILSYCDRIQELLPDCKNNVEFIKEQVKLLPVHKSRLRYSWDLMLFCSLLHSISPHAYRFLRSSQKLKIPSTSTIRQVCGKFSCNPQLEQNPKDLLRYVSSKFSLLSAEDKLVILLMDEIHLKENLDYKSGNIVGNAFNDEKLAKSAHVFMISSLMSPYKEVVHILPVNKMTGEVLHTFLKNIVIGLHNNGFEVLGVVSDNYSINRKAISYFSNPPEVKIVYPNPADENKPLYFVIDTVHILKNIRNNWLNKRNQDFKYPNFSNMEISETASSEALKEMHASESTSLLKYGFNLSLKTLYPSNLERQNVRLAVNIFNSSISIALKELGPRKHFKNWEGTANFIEIISRWWDIVNVKTPLKGQRLRNVFQEPITLTSIHIISFLKTFLSWLSKWELLEDEERFGKYRQLAGSQYHVSVRQIFESEAKLRIQAVMPLALTSHNFGEIIFDVNCVDGASLPSQKENAECNVADILANNCMVDEDDLDEISDTMWPLLTYIGGYCSHQITKKLKCNYCVEFLKGSNSENTRLIAASDRGGLSYPHEDVVRIVASVYIIFQKLISSPIEHVFVKQINQRATVISLGMENIPDHVFIDTKNYKFQEVFKHKDPSSGSSRTEKDEKTNKGNEVRMISGISGRPGDISSFKDLPGQLKPFGYFWNYNRETDTTYNALPVQQN